MEKENKMAVMPMPKLIITMSLPLMLSLLIQSLYNIVDSIFVAKLGEEALTATSLVFPMQMLMIAVGVGTGVGVNAVLSRNIGAKNTAMVENAAMTGLILSLISTVVFMIMGFTCTRSFVYAFTENETIADYSVQYLSICMIFCVGSLVSTMFQRFLQSVGDTFYSMVSLIAGAVTNIILDPIMIFGLVGFPVLGIRGAAIATVIGQCVSAVVAIWLNTVKNPTVKITWKNYKIDKQVVAQIYRVGLPTIVTQAIGSVMMAAVNGILMPFSSTAVAFFGVYYKLQNFLFMPMNGLGQAAIPIVGFCYGSKNYERIKEAIRTVLPIGIGISLAATVLFMVFPRWLLGLFSPSSEMLVIGIPALRIICVTFAFASVTMILGYAMSGLGNGLINMLGTALRQLIIFVPLAYLFASYFGIEKVWYSMWISEIAAMGYAIVASKSVLRKRGILQARLC
ncbi:MAG: MATE family efflux transporter [Lachnospiraceae bacterium]|nr:MATE family efflux transporter [Lachnospiraceae bacterium]